MDNSNSKSRIQSGKTSADQYSNGREEKQEFTGKNINEAIIDSITNSSPITCNHFLINSHPNELKAIIEYFEKHDQPFLKKVMKQNTNHHEALSMLTNKFAAIFNPTLDKEMEFENDVIYSNNNKTTKYVYNTYEFPLNGVFKNKQWEEINYFMMWVAEVFDGYPERFDYYLDMDLDEMVTYRIAEYPPEEKDSELKNLLSEYFMIMLIEEINKEFYYTEVIKAKRIFNKIMKSKELPEVEIKNQKEKNVYIAFMQTVNLCKQHKGPLNYTQCGVESNYYGFPIVEFFVYTSLYSQLSQHIHSDKYEMINADPPDFYLGPVTKFEDDKITVTGSKENTEYFNEINRNLTLYLQNIDVKKIAVNSIQISETEINEIITKLQYHSFENCQDIRAALGIFIGEQDSRIDYSKCPTIKRWVKSIIRKRKLPKRSSSK